MLTFEFTKGDREEKKMGVIGHGTLIPEGSTSVLREPYSTLSRQTDSQVRLVIDPTVCEKNGNI